MKRKFLPLLLTVVLVVAAAIVPMLTLTASAASLVKTFTMESSGSSTIGRNRHTSVKRMIGRSRSQISSGCPWMYIFRKEIADRNSIRFAEGVMHEDEDFNTKIYYYGKKLIVCNCIAYNYCRRESSITVNSDSLHEARRISHLFRLLERLTAFRFEQQEVCTMEQRAALNRKLTMLTVDTLLNLFYNDWSAKEVEEACHEGLYPLGLYPLPDKNYSLKYRIFAALSNSRTGLKILRKILPSQKPQ